MYNQIDSNKRNTVLLIGIFLVVIIFLGWFFSYQFNNQLILVIAVIIAVSQAFISYYYSDKITLAISGAHEVKHNENPQLYHIVENLCITAGLPVPKIYIIDDSAPNAFATGRDPKHAVICVTRGLLDKLNKTELEGVISHELSHIGNFDIRLMTITVVLVGIVSLLSDWFLRWSWWGDSRRRDDNSQLGGILALVAIILVILSPIIAQLIKLAISRKREFLADASGALLTRYPDGLANALEKIARDHEPLEAANKATAHLYIENPFKEGEKRSVSWFVNLFNTHPPVEERIKKLRAIIGK
ncbi:zinc metalloprotease HtpX [Candidatus Berkelbacteria bacterium RIFCSPHIGHO2_12_FULL_36_9]|uniref:Protease HtpX homolog n=1 Tax=Candidatus Berkelbacteria bacterium RIFCSPHIGHO2_12_FULL_36_9 TaxID=1797469 RepID=A0A1F5EJU3_9BACT|nr:MAG: zinc metalloprotease HtpX [Candidatus Berkelbacteria bacterium RIFCSPHIGHO2_12_FULL_36_9]